MEKIRESMEREMSAFTREGMAELARIARKSEKQEEEMASFRDRIKQTEAKISNENQLVARVVQSLESDIQRSDNQRVLPPK